mmetsp:Transcript_1680/g.2330  ORF Transcript_1680/g.2330 Transcript_1680/m.2330 type:complete len:287 (+) Transcript_1680:697-1557(+)
MKPNALKDSAGVSANSVATLSPSSRILSKESDPFCGGERFLTIAPFPISKRQQRSDDTLAQIPRELEMATAWIAAPAWPIIRSRGLNGQKCDEMKRHSETLPSALPTIASSPPTPPCPAAVPMGSIFIAVMRSACAAGTITSPRIAPFTGSTSCIASAPLPSPSLRTSKRDRFANKVCDKQTITFRAADENGRRGMVRKLNNSLCATKHPASLKMSMSVPEEVSSEVYPSSSSSPDDSSLNSGFHAHRKKWNIPFESTAKQRSDSAKRMETRGACGPGGGAPRCTQ